MQFTRDKRVRVMEANANMKGLKDGKALEAVKGLANSKAGKAIKGAGDNKFVRRILPKLKKHRKLLIILLIIALGALILRGCMGKGADSAAGNYELVNPQKRDITVSVGGTGALEAANSRTILATVTGDVTESNYSEGDEVRKGDLILKIDSTDADRRISSAEDAVAQAEIGVRQAQLAVENARLGSSTAGESAADLNIKSNFAGQVTDLAFVPGDSIAAGSVAATVTDSKTALLKLPFHSSDAKNIKAGQSAVISISSTGETLGGTVREVSGVETVGIGGILTREVTIAAQNPGGITETTFATAMVGEYACAAGGSFEYNVSKSVISSVSGKIAAVSVSEGDWVAVGQTIMTVENSSVSSSSQTANNSLQTAQLSLSNAQLVYEGAVRALEETRETMDDYVISAPIDGTLAFLGFSAGEHIAESDLQLNKVLQIYDMSSLQFVVDVDELDIGKIRPGQTVTVTADAVSGETFTGEVESVSISGEVTDGVTTYPVTVRIKEYGALLPGMNVSADILVEAAKDILTIPITAVSRGNTVLVKDDASEGDSLDGVAKGYRRVQITTGRNDEDYIEVRSGLFESDTIAIDISTSSLMEDMAEMDRGQHNG